MRLSLTFCENLRSLVARASHTILHAMDKPSPTSTTCRYVHPQALTTTTNRNNQEVITNQPISDGRTSKSKYFNLRNFVVFFFITTRRQQSTFVQGGNCHNANQAIEKYQLQSKVAFFSFPFPHFSYLIFLFLIPFCIISLVFSHKKYPPLVLKLKEIVHSFIFMQGNHLHLFLRFCLLVRLNWSQYCYPCFLLLFIFKFNYFEFGTFPFLPFFSLY